MDKKLMAIILGSVVGLTVACKNGAAQQGALAEDSSTQTQTGQGSNAASGEQSATDSSLTGVVIDKAWTFDYKDGAFPCDTTGGCLVKGFAVDGDSVFYVMGGTQTAIAQYRGTHLLHRKELGIDLSGSYNALLHTHGDSVYFIDEQERVIYSIDKGLRGSATAFHLPFEVEDSIISGRMEENGYVLVTQRRYKEEQTTTAWRLEYPNLVRKKVLGESDMYALLSGYCQLGEEADGYFYLGTVGEYRVFLTPPEYDNCSAIVANASGDCTYQGPINGLPPIAAVSGYEEHYGALQSENLRVISNDRLYLTGYDSNTHRFTILAIGF